MLLLHAALRRLSSKSDQPKSIIFVIALEIGAVVLAKYIVVGAGSGNTMLEVMRIDASVDHRQTYPDRVRVSHYPRPGASNLRRGSLRSRGYYVRVNDEIIFIEDNGRVKVRTIQGKRWTRRKRRRQLGRRIKCSQQR